MNDDSSFLPIGTQLSLKYTIIGHIGAGGFGKTYLVSNELGNGEQLVVKEFYIAQMCNRDTITKKVSVSNENRESFENLRKSFLKEATKVSKLNHPHIVKVVDMFEANDTVYYVMNRVVGESLADKIYKGEKLSEARVMRYLNQLLDALEYIHSRNPGIMHLDIKPGNIMIDENDNVVLIDFGASKSFNSTSVNQTLMSTVGLLYTSGYAPIEQENGNVDDLGSHCDIYALGATLFKIYTGQTPPKPYDIRKKGLPTITGASPLMQKIIKKALEFDYDNRIKTVAEFRAMLCDEELTDSDPIKPRNDDPTLTQETLKTPKTPETAPIPTPKPKKEDKSESLSEYLKKPPVKITLAAAIILLICYLVSLTKGGSAVSTEPVDTAEVVASVEPAPVAETFTETVKGVSFKMIAVEGGTFTMGATSEQGTNDPGSDERPTHSVTLGDYYIGETEVTQALWEAVMGTTVSQQRDKADPSWPLKGEGDDYPMYYVSWEEAKTFCEGLSKITGRNYSLPTEAEWEYAARGGKSGGYKYSGSDNVDDVAWYNEDYVSGSTHRVKRKKANELGIYDMSGNVWEWCSDWYGSYSSSSHTNPTGPSSGSNRVFRGGSWSRGAQYCRVSFRYSGIPGGRYNCGFRLALHP